jgi:hypothetical protein
MTIFEDSLGSGTFAWCARPLHMLRRIVISHNLVTDIKNTLTCCKISTKTAFQRDTTPKTLICLGICSMTQERSLSLRPNPISI